MKVNLIKASALISLAIVISSMGFAEAKLFRHKKPNVLSDFVSTDGGFQATCFANNPVNKNKLLGNLGGVTYQTPSVITNVTVAPALTGYQANGTATASSTLILSSNNGRNYARCNNTSNGVGSAVQQGIPLSLILGTNSTLGYGATSSVLTGIILSPTASSSPNTSFFEITPGNAFTGAVYAYSFATTTISCIEN